VTAAGKNPSPGAGQATQAGAARRPGRASRTEGPAATAAGENPPPRAGQAGQARAARAARRPGRARRSGRRGGDSGTREAILAAARARFGDLGYDRATIRGIADDAGVDAALVHHFYGTKDQLFAAAMRLP